MACSVHSFRCMFLFCFFQSLRRCRPSSSISSPFCHLRLRRGSARPRRITCFLFRSVCVSQKTNHKNVMDESEHHIFTVYTVYFLLSLLYLVVVLQRIVYSDSCQFKLTDGILQSINVNNILNSRVWFITMTNKLCGLLSVPTLAPRVWLSAVRQVCLCRSAWGVHLQADGFINVSIFMNMSMLPNVWHK